MDLETNQKRIRKHLRMAAIKRRDDIPPNVRLELSQQIAKHVIAWIETHSVDVVMLYLGMRSEVETDGLLDYLLTHSKIALAPVTDVKECTLTPHRIVNPKIDLVHHRYGMREPNHDTCPPFPLNQIDLILVPGLAFDLNGYRIGYGGGFYDRFLPKCPRATWIGLAYQAQIIDDVFPEPWDVVLHQVITENGCVKRET